MHISRRNLLGAVSLTLSALVQIALVQTGPGALADTPAPAAKLPAPQISEERLLPVQSVDVLGERMTYVERGSGAPVLFLHGNPTSSYLWRNILPHVPDGHRAIAVDLIGMGGSTKPDIAYSPADHARYVAAFIDALDLRDITLVGHDWGAALAWDFARRNPGRVAKIAFMEGVLPPTFPLPTFEAMGPDMAKLFRAWRDPEQGHAMVIENNMFVEQLLPMMVNRPLGNQAMAVYRAPYTVPANRKPTLEWPRALPIAGDPAASVEMLAGIERFMGETAMPVLLLYAEPGAIVPPQAVSWYTDKIRNIETGYIGQGLHFIQEDQPVAIGRALADWMRRH